MAAPGAKIEFEGTRQMSEPIVLCLSGGGLRATFFHLGIIASLKRRKLLGDVTDIYAPRRAGAE